MEEKKLKNEFMQHIAEQAAWKQLSEDLAWSGAMLEKWKDKLDWDEISQNTKIIWTIPMLRKFKKQINWSELSSCAEKETLTEECIEEFKDSWDWKELSANSDLPITDEFLEKYANHVHWESIYDCRRYRENNIWSNDPIGFYERYQQHIPESKLQGTTLWDAITEQLSKKMREKVME